MLIVFQGQMLLQHVQLTVADNVSVGVVIGWICLQAVL
jgi:hypothetical protein